MKRIAHVLLLTLATAACRQAPTASSAVAAIFEGSAGQWVDLTYPFNGQSIYWPTARGFQLDTVSYGTTEGGWFYAAFDYTAAEHVGTHMDAPIHFAEGHLTADRVPLQGLIGPAAVIDVSERADADYLVSVTDLQAWEGRHGELPNGGILLLRTGWGSRYGDRTAYLGTDLTGSEALSHLHFPGLDPEAARWLVAERGIVAVGIDTPSIDRGQSATFDCERVLYAENIVGFDNVANLDLLPEAGSYVVALPMKIEGGSGAPLRIVAFIPHS